MHKLFKAIFILSVQASILLGIPTTFKPFNTTCAGRNIYGEILYTPPPKAGNYFHIQTPEGSCSNLATVSKTAKYYGCSYATNSGLFDMFSGACIGNVVDDGQIIQQQDTPRVNFGVFKNGSLWVGYLPNGANLNEFQQLVTGACWLVKDGQNNVGNCEKNEGIDTGFITEMAPRLSVGFDQKEGLIMIAVNGYESTKQGMSLTEFADLAIGLGVWQLANLDGGGSLAVVANGVIENTCSDGCIDQYNSDYPCSSYPGVTKKVCERLVTTITCFK